MARLDDSGASKQHVFMHPSPVEHWRHLIEILALLTAALWGLYVFVYQERIKPAYEAPSLDIGRIVRHENAAREKELVTVLLSIKNIGATAAQLDGLFINVYGIRYSDTASKRLDPTPTLALDASLPVARRTALASLKDLFMPFGGHMGGGVLKGLARAVLNPGFSKDFGFTLAVPRGLYDAVAVEYSYCYQRADDPGTTRYVPVRAADGTLDAKSLMAFGKARNGVSCGWTPPLRADAL